MSDYSHKYQIHCLSVTGFILTSNIIQTKNITDKTYSPKMLHLPVNSHNMYMSIFLLHSALFIVFCICREEGRIMRHRIVSMDAVSFNYPWCGCTVGYASNARSKQDARSCENVSYAICEQQRYRSACASAQSDQHHCCSLLRLYDMYTCSIQSFKILASFCS